MAKTDKITLTIAATEGAYSGPISFENYWIGELRTVAAFTNAIGIQTWAGTGTPTGDETDWCWLKNPSGTNANDIYGVDTPQASSAYALPPEISVAQWIRFKPHDGSGNDATEAAARTVYLVKKYLDS